MPRNPNNPFGGPWRNTTGEICALLDQKGPLTIEQIAYCMSLNHRTIGAFILKARELFYVADYAPNPKNKIRPRMWAVRTSLDQVDAEPPAPITPSERTRTYRERLRARAETDTHLKRSLAAKRVRRNRKERDKRRVRKEVIKGSATRVSSIFELGSKL